MSIFKYKAIRYGSVALVVGVAVAGAAFGFWWQEKNRQVTPSEYHLTGAFGPVVSWPVIPIHLVLLPDGRVMNFGSDGKGNQGAQLAYDVWDPRKGFGDDAHLVLPNTVGTDIFCIGQIIVPSNDQVLLVSGDVTKGKLRNYSTKDINWFDPAKNALRRDAQKLNQLRWYPTVVTLPNGDVFVGGGRTDQDAYTDEPEVYHPGTGWKALPGARNEAAFGKPNWTYPLTWVAPNGKLFIISTTGQTFYTDADGEGHIESTGVKVPWSDFYQPAVMFQPGKVLSLRKRGKAVVIDLNGDKPQVQPTQSFGFGRTDGSLTVMADGKVLLNGGSFIHKRDVLVHYGAELWDPTTGLWSRGPRAEKMRLYHSVSMLLPDGTVLTGGGGAGGDITPQTNLNAEVYYPPYLFKPDGSGERVEQRPQIAEAPSVVGWGQSFKLTLGDAAQVSKVSFIKTGSVTHTANFEQRYMELPFTQTGVDLTLQAPANSKVATPGYYMVFVFDKAGVPSVAKLVKLS